MEKIVWQNPNKQLTDSGFKTFDKQNLVISTGNVIAPTQLSFYLNEYVIKESLYFSKMSGHELREIMGLASQVIFYEFFVRYGDKKEIFLHIATDASNHRILWERVYNSNKQRQSATKFIKRFISNEEQGIS